MLAELNRAPNYVTIIWEKNVHTIQLAPHARRTSSGAKLCHNYLGKKLTYHTVISLGKTSILNHAWFIPSGGTVDPRNWTSGVWAICEFALQPNEMFTFARCMKFGPTGVKVDLGPPGPNDTDPRPNLIKTQWSDFLNLRSRFFWEHWAIAIESKQHNQFRRRSAQSSLTKVFATTFGPSNRIWRQAPQSVLNKNSAFKFDQKTRHSNVKLCTGFRVGG